MVKIFLVRHGQTLWNSEQKYMGSSDIALTEDGVRQAEKLADRLAAEKNWRGACKRPFSGTDNC